MKVFRSKGYACKKQFSNDNLPSRPYPSTTSLGESRRVSLADWTTLFTHPYLYLHLKAVPVSKLVSLAAAAAHWAPLLFSKPSNASERAQEHIRWSIQDLTGDDLEPAAAWKENLNWLGSSCGTSSCKGEGAGGKRTEQHVTHPGVQRPCSIKFSESILKILRLRGGAFKSSFLTKISHLGPSHLNESHRVSASLFCGLDHPIYPSLHMTKEMTVR